MTTNQEPKNEKARIKATNTYRLVAGCLFVLVVGFFVYMFLGARGIINLRSQFGICGFKQSYGLPCPGCGWTTSTLAFVQGHVGQSLYIQPAACVFCIAIAISGVFALLSAVLAIRFSFLDRPFAVIVKYVVLAIIILVAGGWAVTLSRAMADNGG
jgi:hypothetical protein